MCADPITLTLAASAAATAVGSAVEAAGQVAQGKQADAMANLQAKAYERQAEADAKASGFEMMQERRKQELQQSAARAQVGASGVAFTGSPTEVLTANAGQGELDLQAIMYGSALRQGNLTTQAAISRYGGAQARRAGYIAGASTLVSGIAKSVQMGASAFK